MKKEKKKVEKQDNTSPIFGLQDRPAYPRKKCSAGAIQTQFAARKQ